MLKTAIVGAGNMGSALYQGIRQATDLEVYLCDRNESKLAIAPAHCRFTNVSECIHTADCFVIAVKLQSFVELMNNIGKMWSDKFIVSIMAGVSIAHLEKLTGSHRIVRAMPNLGARICRSATGWCASDGVKEKERMHTKTLFQSVGLGIELATEDKIDAFTAIAGSGPAYVFGLAELLEQAALKLDLSANESADIAAAVIAAGSLLLEEKTMSASEWRKAVTSKGGVTEAAMAILSKKQLPQIFDDALEAGTQRSRTLSSEYE